MNETDERRSVDDGDPTHLIFSQRREKKQARPYRDKCAERLAFFLIQFLFTQKLEDFTFETSRIAIESGECEHSREATQKCGFVYPFFHDRDDYLLTR